MAGSERARTSSPPERSARVALVTGASSGIGMATAAALAADVAVVVVHYRGNARGAERSAEAVAAAGAKSILQQADLTRPDAVAAMAERVLQQCGRVDILINNAGGTERVPILDCTPEQWQRTFAQNLEAAFHCTRVLLPGMLARGWGRIVNVSSMAGLRGGDPQETVHYAAAKAALNVYTQGLARAVARTGVTVNVVAPGFVDTPLQDQPPGRRQQFEKKAASTPAGRPGRPAEIASAIRFVASEAASYLIGEVITVSGGI
ncbi:MAG TPA: SDR family NAD(P)-dependent oxidoreductase [Candidatus Sulfotelmatobacter sp.]|nr:SDR family NAD(P)-dependent oxidoreductase [Candidatus Sulfotelmatobacter sp.]